MFDRETYIRSNLQAHYNEAVQSGQMVFCLILQGSQNYGLDINNEKYQSDIDTKAIILPSFEDFCRGAAPISTTHIRENNEHIDFKDVRVMFETFKKQNVNFVEVLFSDYYIVAEGYESFWEDLRALAEDLTHCHPTQTLRTMAGLSLEKRKALCHPYPTIKDKIDKYGYDGKQLHHIIRINDFIVCGARDLGEALRRINEGASMIRTKGEPGTGDIVQAVRHMRRMQAEISRVSSMREDELFEAAKEYQVPFELIQYVHKNKKLPVVNFAAGGVATPADAALMMQLGAEGVFVGSGIFKSGEPEKRATAIVKAVTNYDDPALLAELSKNLGEAMVGINENEIQLIMEERGK